ncbi:MAG: hypothetical protein K2L59_01465 [Muribaculaceae bacterium]|nr:hypothetical protein [Muribaculaceae bacterium]
MKNSNTDKTGGAANVGRVRLRRVMEALATFGLILVAAGLAAPFAGAGSLTVAVLFKWVFAAGAVMFTAARIAGSLGRDESLRVRRLRRMETWAGFAFCVAAFFWFYNTSRIDSDVLTFRMLNETILFTLAGAFIQIISSWMLSSALSKEARESKASGKK